MKRTSDGKFQRNHAPIGKVDRKTIRMALDAGIDIATGRLARNGRVTIHTDGRFPGAHKGGDIALRSRVVWWLNTGEVVIGCKIFDIHHKNKIRDDDRFSNLEKKYHRSHSLEHNPKKEPTLIKRVCENCKSEFLIDAYRLRDPSRGKFCSQGCYHQHARSEHHRRSISMGLRLAYREGRR